MNKKFLNRGNIHIINDIERIELPPEDIKNGINVFKDFFVYKNSGDISIYDRNCDHANGKLVKNGNEIICPLHEWCFDYENGSYKNVNKKKHPIEYIVDSNGKICFNISRRKPSLPKLGDSKEISISFVTHAFIIIESKEFKFAMDPWAIGPAFVGGWWLATPPIKTWEKKLNECDFIYISHNHPDHLNRHTLKLVRKDMIFIIPNFISKSVEKLLISIGFINIVKMEFQKYYQYENTNLILTLLKSADFRDDSGIYFTYGSFSLFSAVDANNINNNEFPDDTTLFLSSFAGGASGYPLCHDHLEENEKSLIIKRNRKSISTIVKKNVKSINAKYFMPYAGFFKELAKRDKYIKTNNCKNSIDDYEQSLKNYNILNVLTENRFNFIGENLISSEKLEIDEKNDNPEKWIEANIKVQFSSNLEIIKYFEKSNFQSNLTLFLLLTNDDFSRVVKSYKINFKNKIPIVINDDESRIHNYQDDENNLLSIKVREHSFYYLINNRLPWENLSIGFQCRIDRKPDLYNNQFWYHFTNIYF